eukprot:TRINITY_DN49992_c0_g1_i1.p1 TRINITY_DN49992_c0_g1~~TRINITY_DN49992_c0_g1_i1.p1  ORF type:complete len:297 (-),score=29.04 TRINITY_DN49992_c0_g1_i1:221-1111(-)
MRKNYQKNLQKRQLQDRLYSPRTRTPPNRRPLSAYSKSERLQVAQQNLRQNRWSLASLEPPPLDENLQNQNHRNIDDVIKLKWNKWVGDTENNNSSNYQEGGGSDNSDSLNSISQAPTFDSTYHRKQHPNYSFQQIYPPQSKRMQQQYERIQQVVTKTYKFRGCKCSFCLNSSKKDVQGSKDAYKDGCNNDNDYDNQKVGRLKATKSQNQKFQLSKKQRETAEVAVSTKTLTPRVDRELSESDKKFLEPRKSCNKKHDLYGKQRMQSLRQKYSRDELLEFVVMRVKSGVGLKSLFR